MTYGRADDLKWRFYRSDDKGCGYVQKPQTFIFGLLCLLLFASILINAGPYSSYWTLVLEEIRDKPVDKIRVSSILPM